MAKLRHWQLVRKPGQPYPKGNNNTKGERKQKAQSGGGGAREPTAANCRHALYQCLQEGNDAHRHHHRCNSTRLVRAFAPRPVDSEPRSRKSGQPGLRGEATWSAPMAFSGRGLTAIAAIIIVRALRGIFIRGMQPRAHPVANSPQRGRSGPSGAQTPLHGRTAPPPASPRPNCAPVSLLAPANAKKNTGTLPRRWHARGRTARPTPSPL
jgi:hypothetical protein